MPIYSATVTGPAQFDGATAATGLFDAAANTGAASIQVRINSISFSGEVSSYSTTNGNCTNTCHPTCYSFIDMENHIFCIHDVSVPFDHRLIWRPNRFVPIENNGLCR